MISPRTLERFPTAINRDMHLHALTRFHFQGRYEKCRSVRPERRGKERVKVHPLGVCRLADITVRSSLRESGSHVTCLEDSSRLQSGYRK
jgi:hypothetical protein